MESASVFTPEGRFRLNVCMVVCDDRGQVLLAKPVEQGYSWQFPQGGVDVGETLDQAMARELREEVGLPRSAVTLLGTTDRGLTYLFPPHKQPRDLIKGFVGQMQHWFLLGIREAAKSLVDLQTSADVKPEFSECSWVDYWAPLKQVVDFKREVYRRALTELEPYLTDFRSC